MANGDVVLAFFEHLYKDDDKAALALLADNATLSSESQTDTKAKFTDDLTRERVPKVKYVFGVTPIVTSRGGDLVEVNGKLLKEEVGGQIVEGGPLKLHIEVRDGRIQSVNNQLSGVTVAPAGALADRIRHWPW